MSTTKLKEFIKSIRNCKTAKDERSVISKESALIRNAFKVKSVIIRIARSHEFIIVLDFPHDLLSPSQGTTVYSLFINRRKPQRIDIGTLPSCCL